jgi:hypothetical protein
MSKCKHCGKEIGHIVIRRVDEIELDEEGRIDENDAEHKMEHAVTYYCCPECDNEVDFELT